MNFKIEGLLSPHIEVTHTHTCTHEYSKTKHEGKKEKQQPLENLHNKIHTYCVAAQQHTIQS